MSFFDSLKKKIQELLGVNTAVPKTQADPEDPFNNSDFGLNSADTIWRNHLDDLLQHNATDKVRYADYDLMDQEIPEVSVALDIMADECVSINDRGDMLSIYSTDSRIKKVLKSLFHQTFRSQREPRKYCRKRSYTTRMSSYWFERRYFLRQPTERHCRKNESIVQ